MAVIKVKRPNGEEHVFNLTENAQDTGGNYICVRFNGQNLYARVSGNVTPLNVVKANGDKGYVQYDPITFNTWKWEARNVESFNKWYVYLPKGKYRILMEAVDTMERELTIPSSKNIEITVTTKRMTINTHIVFNIDGQILIENSISKRINRLTIERTGNI